jgi:hypothetical protein
MAASPDALRQQEISANYRPEPDQIRTNDATVSEFKL